MKNLYNTLHHVWLVLTSRRFVLFVPTGPYAATVGEAGAMSARAWASLALYAGYRAEQAQADADARLLAELEAARDEDAMNALAAEITAILSR